MNKVILTLIGLCLLMTGCANPVAEQKRQIEAAFDRRLAAINAMPPGPERERLGRQYNQDIARAKAEWDAYRYAKLAQIASMQQAQREERAVSALEQIAQQQQSALVPQQSVSVPYVPTPELPPQFGTYPGSRVNPIRVQVVPTPTPGTMFAPLP
jgi:hypothetical protein